jgi:hypothetical protein
MVADPKIVVPAVTSPALLVLGDVIFNLALVDTVQHWAESLVREILDGFWSGMSVLDIAAIVERPPDQVAALIYSTF